ncbi:glutathione S-transferase family protein [Sphingomonas ginkgonis]|uniref:Glutathione S-transferase family protein n=1 Tax=Sphingomonas ginkgonis TaxID=2315330 RepID=A0A3R9YLL0_9SPHN|nr:glutathione S-transferase family protein [Sphingomonas ginkgonis]RST30294.1 glutathione S-transferase family protein [Sphingomonas ginkgonis]
MTLTLFTANRNYSSWSLRPWVLMKVLGIPFEDRIVTFAGLDNRAAFRAFSPTGTVPALHDGGRVVWDSLGIALYLADRFAGVWPEDEAARAWAQCAVCEMHAGFAALRNDCTMNVGVRVRRHPDSPALARDLARIAELFEEGLERFGGPFLAGPAFTAADAFYAPVVYRVRTYDIALGPLATGWSERMLALPAMRAWEEAALAEPYREAGHEAELAAAGAILEDRRRA